MVHTYKEAPRVGQYPSQAETQHDISMKTVNDLCRILDCDIEDIAVYVPSEKDQLL